MKSLRDNIKHKEDQTVDELQALGYKYGDFAPNGYKTPKIYHKLYKIVMSIQ